jgi:photosystem II stability/assembly factor-like uncharacterized protein
MKMFVVLFFVSSAPLPAQNYGWVKVAKLGSALQTVEFVDSLHGWTAYGSDAIYRTTDGGSSWISYASNAPFLVKSISFVDTLNGWCAGTDGTTGDIIHTTDGGKTWSWQLEKYPRQYLSTHALSKNKNITFGQTKNASSPDTGRIAVTTDAGKTWTEQALADSIEGIYKLFFLDSLHGWAGSQITNGQQALLRTQDGGTSWQVLPNPEGQYIFFFIDTLQGWKNSGASSGAEIYHTIDQGRSWQYLTYIHDSDPLSGDNLNIRAIAFFNSLSGRAFGSIFYQGIITEGIYRTTDGGHNWFRESIGLTGDIGGISDAKMLDLYHGCAVCSDGSVLRYQPTTDVVDRLPEIPGTFSLRQNYPNPFNPVTTIEYDITKRAHVSLTVYDLLGRKIEVLVDKKQEAGTYRVRFDGSQHSSGVYFYQLTTGGFVRTKEMALLK